jgi:hypothetical protein
MVKCALVGATAVSLAIALAAPASAGDVQSTGAQSAKTRLHAAARRPVVNSAGDPILPVENALRWGYSQGYQYYPSGFGGLYGDGRYPGNVIDNRNYPSWW